METVGCSIYFLYNFQQRHTLMRKWHEWRSSFATSNNNLTHLAFNSVTHKITKTHYNIQNHNHWWPLPFPPDGSSSTHLIICLSVCHKVSIRHGLNEIYFQLFLIGSSKRRLVLQLNLLSSLTVNDMPIICI